MGDESNEIAMRLVRLAQGQKCLRLQERDARRKEGVVPLCFSCSLSHASVASSLSMPAPHNSLTKRPSLRVRVATFHFASFLAIFSGMPIPAAHTIVTLSSGGVSIALSCVIRRRVNYVHMEQENTHLIVRGRTERRRYNECERLGAFLGLRE